MQPQQPYNGPRPPSPLNAKLPEITDIPSNSPPVAIENRPPEHYEFILNPPKPSRSNLFTTKPTLKRVVVLLTVAIILIVIVSFLSNLFSGKSNIPILISVAQQQQEIIHLATGGVSGTGSNATLSTNNSNFAITTQETMLSQQAALLTYFKTIKHKLNPKLLYLGVHPAIDTQLLDSQAATTYDQTFTQVMQAQLDSYASLLNQAYKLTPGIHGRQLLTTDYNQDRLLLLQLNSGSKT